MKLRYPPSYIKEFLVCPRRFRYLVNLPGIEDKEKLDEYREISELLSNTQHLKFYPRPDKISGEVIIEYKQGDYTQAADAIQLFAYMCLYDFEIGLLYYLKANKIVVYKLDRKICEDLEELNEVLDQVASLPSPPEGTEDRKICRYCSFRDVCPRGGL